MVNIDLRRYRLRNVVGPGLVHGGRDQLLIRKFETFRPERAIPSRDIQGLEGRFRQGVNLRVPRSEAVRGARG